MAVLKSWQAIAISKASKHTRQSVMMRKVAVKHCPGICRQHQNLKNNILPDGMSDRENSRFLPTLASRVVFY